MEQTSSYRKALIIAHEFPPISGGQVMRMLKFARYLPEFGWQPIVVTAKPEDCYYLPALSLDPGLLAQLDETVQIISSTSPLERWTRDGVNKLKNTLSSQFETQPVSRTSASAGKVSLFQAIKRIHVTQDQSALWLPKAYSAALSVIQKDRPQVMLTTSPPHLLQVVGYLLRRTTKIGWVADFRDGWTDNSLFQSNSHVRQSFDKWIELLVVRNADYIVVVTKHMQQSFQNRYPQHADKVKLIHNGYDSHDFEKLHRSPDHQSKKLTFSYLGNWGGFRNPSTLFSAFEQLFEENSLSRDQVVLSFTGNYHAGGIPIPDWVTVDSPIAHQEALQRMINSDVLVLLTDITEREAAFTSKVFEYLAAKRVILGIVPPTGELADLLNNYSLGVVASPEDVQQIKEAILLAYNMARSNQSLTTDDLDMIRKYDRRQQALQLAHLFKEL